MGSGRVGIAIQALSPSETLGSIERAEELGVASAWLTTGGAGPDGLTILSAAAARTKGIKLGTSIVPAFPRHPLVMVQQAQVVAGIAPGRLVLGIGPSHGPAMVPTFGVSFERPLEHLREYLTVVKMGLQKGQVDFDGAFVHAHARIPNQAQVPVMMSALSAGSYRAAGEIADGAIAWICPARYLRDVAQPALREGAARAGRDVPPLVAHCFVAPTVDRAEAVRAAVPRISHYPKLPFYARMLVAAGFPEAQRGEWSERMLDAIVVHGDDAAIADGLRAFMATAGARELIASPIPVGADDVASRERVMSIVAEV